MGIYSIARLVARRKWLFSELFPGIKFAGFQLSNSEKLSAINMVYSYKPNFYPICFSNYLGVKQN